MWKHFCRKSFHATINLSQIIKIFIFEIKRKLITQKTSPTTGAVANNGANVPIKELFFGLLLFL